MKKAIKAAKKHADELERVEAKSRVKKRRRPVKKETILERAGRRLAEVFYQPKTKFTPSHGKTTKGLKRAGLTKKEIKKLR